MLNIFDSIFNTLFYEPVQIWVEFVLMLICLVCFLSESDDQNYRVCAVHALVHKLPDKNKEMLEILIKHLLKYDSVMNM